MGLSFNGNTRGMPRVALVCIAATLSLFAQCAALAAEAPVIVSCQETRGGACFDNLPCRPDARVSRILLMMGRLPAPGETAEGYLQECVQGEECGSVWPVQITSNTLQDLVATNGPTEAININGRSGVFAHSQITVAAIGAMVSYKFGICNIPK
jgi:hypothetical protein